VRATPVQGALGTSSRAANARGAFAPSLTSRWTARRIAGADVWLVDDVLTSGSTAAGMRPNPAPARRAQRVRPVRGASVIPSHA